MVYKFIVTQATSASKVGIESFLGGIMEFPHPSRIRFFLERGPLLNSL